MTMIKINIKLLSGQIMEINASEEETISELKKLVKLKEGVLLDKINLVRGFKILDNEKTVKESKLEAGEQIDMMMLLSTS